MYADILQALFIVFTVPPWHRNVGRAILQTPKVYFFDTGLVRGDQGMRLENAVACMLLRQAHFLLDSEEAHLHCITSAPRMAQKSILPSVGGRIKAVDRMQVG